MIAIVLCRCLFSLIHGLLLISMEREYHARVTVDLLVVLEDNLVVKLWISHVLFDPSLLDSLTLSHMVF